MMDRVSSAPASTSEASGAIRADAIGVFDSAWAG